MRLCGWCNSVQERRCRLIEHVSMPHAALWVVQPWIKESPICEYLFQCRTRLCGWCNDVSSIEWIYQSKFQCRTRLCGWCNGLESKDYMAIGSFNAARGFVGGATDQEYLWKRYQSFQCRTRLCGWCNLIGELPELQDDVSMPHAALWVVQQ